jgi:hypothetical protein
MLAGALQFIPSSTGLYVLLSCSVAVLHNLPRITCPIQVPAGSGQFLRVVLRLSEPT